MLSSKYFFIFLCVFTLILVGSGIYFVNSISPKTTPQLVGIFEINLAGSVSLEASPAPAGQTIGQEFTLDINARSGTDAVLSVNLDMVYDSSKLEVKSLTKTDYLPTYISGPTIGSGRIQANFGLLGTDTVGKTDWGTVAKIRIKPLALGKQTIDFGSGTIATSSGFPTGALKSVTPIVITVYNVGDINKDKEVWLNDYNIFVSEFDKSGYSPADIDKSGQVNLNDYKLFVENFGRTSP